MNRTLAASLSVALLAALVLAGCNREDVGPPAPGSTSSASAASGAAGSASAAAAPLVPSSSPSLIVPANVDTAAGRQIAAQGAPGAAACASCHGAGGEGNGGSGFPRLAALGSVYTLHQLNSYADGTRANPVMTPIASALSPQQRVEVAVYYSTLGAPPQAAGAASGSAPAAPPQAGTAASAPVLAVRGDESRGIQACVNCHGPQGIGDAGPNPYLAGQHAAYLANAMAAWKSGARHNDPSGQMPAIAKALDDGQVQALVAYFSALPPPQPRNAQAVAAAGTHEPPVKSGPVTATAPTQGVGTDQGASTTGASQSQGVGGAAGNPAQGPNR
ncbi:MULTISPECIES: c-type cytochrome [Ramlibacter]|uniref:C-type cytochrome n=1 Tax=Ramlibacter aquaticus TaxID=2780094 RepID=A0ABR9SK26_9BURK|nr:MULTISPECIES: c-type cytochrome [Ramlibacter]MBE7942721.1 c-type cytochrome [Ramlibacter aquaticus]